MRQGEQKIRNKAHYPGGVDALKRMPLVKREKLWSIHKTCGCSDQHYHWVGIPSCFNLKGGFFVLKTPEWLQTG